MRSIIIFLFMFSSFIHLSCNITKNDIKPESQEEKTQRIKNEVKGYSKGSYSPEFFEEIVCDSLYPNNHYKISIKGNYDFLDKNDCNSEFILYQLDKNKYVEIYKDSIFIQYVNDIKFEDFNNDNVKDILIHNISDVRSNWTYNLYLVDLKNNKLKKIKGFNEIKNPRFLSKYNIIDNEVMSGSNWTSFYKIEGDSIKDFGYVIYQGEDEEGNLYNYEEDYNNTLKKIIKNKK